jgi:Phage integrase, N-terminal SAM-like domain
VSVERVVRNNGEVVWRVRWREGQRNRSKVLGRKRDAEAFDAEVRHRRRTGALRFLDVGSETLAEYVEGTLATTYAANLAPKTRQTYAWVCDTHIAPRIGGVKLRDLDPELIARFQAELVAAQVGPEARRKAMVLLGGILQRAAEARRIAYNPARLVRKAPIPGREEARPLAPSTIEALRQAVDRRDATVIAILAYAGLRAQELSAIARFLSAPRRRGRAERCGCSRRSPPIWPSGVSHPVDRPRTRRSSRVRTVCPGRPRASTSGASARSRRRSKRPVSRARVRMTSAARSRRCCSTRADRSSTSPASWATEPT